MEFLPAFCVSIAPVYDVVAGRGWGLDAGAGRVQALSHCLTLVVSRNTLTEEQAVGAFCPHVHEEILK